jgi:acyl-CoA hydrolase
VTDDLDADAVAAALDALLPAGGRLAVGDGAGFPLEAWPGVVELLRRRPDVRALLGWALNPLPGTDTFTADRVQTLISGQGMRKPMEAGQVAFVPARLSTVPALLGRALRPDVLVTVLRPVAGGFRFGTEVSWQRAALAAGARVAAVIREKAPAADRGELIGDVTVLGDGGRDPIDLTTPAATEVQAAIAERVAGLVPAGARIQVGPGGLGAAVYGALRRPVAVDTGLITDPVVDLARRGLLLDEPVAPYITGTALVYEWAPGRVRLDGVEITHDPGRLRHGRPLVAVNTGFEVDLAGQVNAERTAGGSPAGGIGGQPDYAAAAAATPDGLSVIALPSRTPSGTATLVERLHAPVTTPSHDVDVVVTERGVADLRGRTRAERAAALTALWS